MTNLPFEDPSTGNEDRDYIEYPPLLGSLLILEVLGYEEHVQTVYTPAGVKNPAARANVMVVDGALAGRTYDDALVFPRRLCAQLRPQVGKTVLGRLGQAEPKPGQNPAWMLQKATDEDKAKAAEFLNSKRAGSFAAPSSASSSAPSQTSSEPPF